MHIRNLKLQQKVQSAPYRGIFYLSCLFLPFIYTIFSGWALYISGPTVASQPELAPSLPPAIPVDSTFHLAGSPLEYRGVVFDETHLYGYNNDGISAIKHSDQSQAWSLPINEYISAFGLREGVLFAARHEGDGQYSWTGIDPYTGDVIWQRTPISGFARPIAPYPFMYSSDRLAWLDLQTGETKWARNIDQWFDLKYTFEQNGRLYLFLAAENGVLMVLDAETGESTWEIQIEGATHIFSAAYFTSLELDIEDSDQLCVRRITTAELLWCIPRSKINRANQGLQSRSISAEISGSTLVLKPEWYRLEAFDLETGDLLWAQEAEPAVIAATSSSQRGSRFATHAGSVYYTFALSAGPENIFYKADVRSGQIAWQVAGGTNYDIDLAGSYQGRPLFVQTPYILFVDPENGDVLDVIHSGIHIYREHQAENVEDILYLYAKSATLVTRFVTDITDDQIASDAQVLFDADQKDQAWGVLGLALANKGEMQSSNPLSTLCGRQLELDYVVLEELFDQQEYGRLLEFVDPNRRNRGFFDRSMACPTIQHRLPEAYWLAGQAHQIDTEDDNILSNLYFRYLEKTFPDSPQAERYLVLAQNWKMTLRWTYGGMVALNFLLVCLSSWLTIRWYANLPRGERVQSSFWVLWSSHLLITGPYYNLFFANTYQNAIPMSALSGGLVIIGSCLFVPFVVLMAFISAGYSRVRDRWGSFGNVIGMVFIHVIMAMGLTFGVILLTTLL